jgi:hypothetical protein
MLVYHKIAYFHQLSLTYEIWTLLNLRIPFSNFSLDVIRWHSTVEQAAFRHELRWAWCRSSVMWLLLLPYSGRIVSLVCLSPLTGSVHKQLSDINSACVTWRWNTLAESSGLWRSSLRCKGRSSLLHLNSCVPLLQDKWQVEWIESSRSGLA